MSFYPQLHSSTRASVSAVNTKSARGSVFRSRWSYLDLSCQWFFLHLSSASPNLPIPLPWRKIVIHHRAISSIFSHYYPLCVRRSMHHGVHSQNFAHLNSTLRQMARRCSCGSCNGLQWGARNRSRYCSSWTSSLSYGSFAWDSWTVVATGIRTLQKLIFFHLKQARHICYRNNWDLKSF